MLNAQTKIPLTSQEFNNKYNFSENFLTLKSIQSAIHKTKRERIKNNVSENNSQPSENSAHKCVKSKQMYTFFKNIFQRDPTCIASWKEQYNFDISSAEWVKIFAMPWKLTRNFKVVELQYKITHKIFPSNTMVSNFDTSVSSLCTTCAVRDTTIHTFFECAHAQSFWIDLEKILNINLNLQHYKKIIFGFLEDINEWKMINFSILYAKHFIYINKKSNDNVNSEINIKRYLLYLKHVIAAERHCHLLQNSFEKLEVLINEQLD